MSNLNINKVRILQLPANQFQGEVYYQGILVISTIKFPNQPNCIRALNNKITEFNTLKAKNIPLMKQDGKEIIFGQSSRVKQPTTPKEKPTAEGKTINYGIQGEPTETLSQAVNSSEHLAEEALSNNVEKQEIAPEKPIATAKKPNRKPFTPYGLNGYFVDSKGNVRLMLDRRANARTIVLEPEMFTALADMVKRTQEQQNATTA